MMTFVSSSDMTSLLPMPAPCTRPVTYTARRAAFTLLFLYCFLISPVFAVAQEYNYIHYNTKEGLAGSTVYDMVQDHDGFMWFATDAGLSRFDGTNFKNFTTANGLPDVEVIKLYVDYKGRLWISPFKNTLCYFYQGKMHTADNDSLLKLAKIDAVVTNITGDRDGNILLVDGRFSYILKTKPGHEKLIDLRPYNKEFKGGLPYFDHPSGILLATQDSLFIWQDGKLTLWQTAQNVLKKKLFLTGLSADGSIKTIGYKDGITADFYARISADRKQFKTYLIGSTDGAYLIDTINLDRVDEKFLSGIMVNTVLIDYENNLWFGTTGKGVYKLTSRNFKTFTFPDNRHPEIFSLAAGNNTILAGGGYNKLYEINGSRVKSATFLGPIEKVSRETYNGNRLVSIANTSDSSLFLGYDLFLYHHKANHGRLLDINPTKSIIEAGKDTILVASGRNVVRLNPRDLTLYDTIWPTRATSVGYFEGRTYVGTVDGLFCISKGQAPLNLGVKEPGLRYRVAAICRANDGAIWVATFGGGVFGLKDAVVFARLTTRVGLTSDICRTLFIGKDHLWIGTDKGVNKVDLNKLSLRPRQYTVSDGLPSDIINAIYVDNNLVYIGSPAGLTTFDEKHVSDYSRCDLKLLGLTVSGRPVDPDSINKLAYYDNNIAIDFVAISFKSGGDILYRYRLQGLKETWDSTRQTSLSYPSLPPGKYQLEIVAINKFGVVSSPINIPFYIKAPFWQTWWFLTLVVLIAIALTALLVGARFSVLRKREREKASLEQKVSKLEQLALLSQMNPHFIFNCLNSIQAFIIQNDLESTNQYLTEFARLIRQTMDSAEKGTITVAQEAIYLSRFIELEQMRFGHSFDFAISIDDHLDANDLSIPSMILQPYVENSIRHGIRYKKGQRGMVEVKFRQYGSQLTCIVEDNGIGREEARRVRSKVHVEYQSKGMSLAAERIQALNRQYGAAVTIKIVDKVDGTGAAAGTRIEIGFPLSLLSKLN